MRGRLHWWHTTTLTLFVVTLLLDLGRTNRLAVAITHQRKTTLRWYTRPSWGGTFGHPSWGTHLAVPTQFIPAPHVSSTWTYIPPPPPTGSTRAMLLEICGYRPSHSTWQIWSGKYIPPGPIPPTRPTRLGVDMGRGHLHWQGIAVRSTVSYNDPRTLRLYALPQRLLFVGPPGIETTNRHLATHVATSVADHKHPLPGYPDRLCSGDHIPHRRESPGFTKSDGNLGQKEGRELLSSTMVLNGQGTGFYFVRTINQS